jgi:hypothetical protein
VWVIAVAAAAAIVGDNVGYWIGRMGGRSLLSHSPFIARYTDACVGMAIRAAYRRCECRQLARATSLLGLPAWEWRSEPTRNFVAVATKFWASRPDVARSRYPYLVPYLLFAHQARPGPGAGSGGPSGLSPATRHAFGLFPAHKSETTGLTFYLMSDV